MQTDSGTAVVFSSLKAGDRTIEATDSPLFFNKEKGVAVVPLSQHLVARLVAPLSFHSTNTMRNRRRQRLERLEREWDFATFDTGNCTFTNVSKRPAVDWVPQEKLDRSTRMRSGSFVRSVSTGFGQCMFEAAHRHGIVNCDLAEQHGIAPRER